MRGHNIKRLATNVPGDECRLQVALLLARTTAKHDRPNVKAVVQRTSLYDRTQPGRAATAHCSPPMELYGCWCSSYVLAPVACLGAAAQYATLRDFLYSASPLPLPPGDETQEGWAALPDELLARIFAEALVPARGPTATPLLCASPDASALRTVCRAWRRVHDSRLRFLKPAALHVESLLARFSSVESLDISRCKYPPLDALHAILARLPRLRVLTLKDAGAGPRIAAALAEALSSTSRLRVLNLSSNGIRGTGAASLSDALRARSCSLETLCLRDNMVSSSGAGALAAALRHNMSLRDLDLSHNPIGHDGAVALSSALVHNNTLASLNLGACDLGDDGTVALSQGLANFASLKALSLFSNGITDAGATELARAAGHGACALRSLELRGNPGIGGEGVRALTSAAQSNKRLRHIFLDGPPAMRHAASPASLAAAAEMAEALLHLAAVLECWRPEDQNLGESTAG